MNRGVKDTPLVTALQRWGFYSPILQVGDYVVPGALESYANGIREIIDAIDEEDRQAPFRFQLVGEFWEIHFTNDGALERGIFLDHRGFQHYARLLQGPGRDVPSLVLDGRATNRPSAQAEIDVLSRFSRQEEMGEEEIRIVVAKIEKLNQQMREAKDSGDMDREQALFVEKEAFWDSLHAEEGDTLDTILPQQTKRLARPRLSRPEGPQDRRQGHEPGA